MIQSSTPATIRAWTNLLSCNKYIIIRGFIVLLLIALPLIQPRRYQAQSDCPPALVPQGCFTPPKRDIAFLIDATGSIEQRGQTYNAEVEGVRRALSDPTVIPRDGSTAVSVIVFNEIAVVAVPMRDINNEADAASAASTVSALKCTNIHSHVLPCPFGATFYAPAVQAADIDASRFRSQNPKSGVTRAFVLSSDGLTNDLGAAVKQVETARVASISSGIPFELDFLVIGVDSQSSDFPTSLGTANEMVTPKPANDLPGEDFVIAAGTANVDGASPSDPDIVRQANDYAETVRTIVRGAISKVLPIVTTETDTAPGTVIGKDGPVSLRQAIELANCNGGDATITFAASVVGKTISLTSALPAITSPSITIDGCTGDTCTPAVTIDGGGQINDGLVIRSNRVLVRGLKIANFTHSGILINGACPQDTVGHNRIERNIIQGSPTGIVVLGAANLQNKFSGNAIARPTPADGAPPATLIDLAGDGPTANDNGDADSGPNTLINFPDSMLVTAQDSTVTVMGKLNSPPSGGGTAEIFGVSKFRVVDSHVVVDGVVFLGQTTVNATGDFAAAGLPPSPSGIYTATATDLPSGNPADESANTSELMFDSDATPLPHPTAGFTATLPFGDVNLGTPVTMSATVNNTGTAPLTVTGCSIGRCPGANSDSRNLFTVTNCPTTKTNPGQSATINVTFNPTACGAQQACLLLQTDDPKNPQIAIQLTGNGTSPAKAVVQGGVTQLKFKRVPPRPSPRPNPQTMTFTINNTGCQTLRLLSAALTRGGQPDTTGAFIVSPFQGGTVDVGAGMSQVISVQFNPVIPPVGGLPLPNDVTDTLTIQTSAAPVTMTLIGGVKLGIRLIDPNDPRNAPQISLCRSGDQFVVTFSAYDSNTNLQSATYQFKDGSGRAVGQPITVNDLGSVLQQQGIKKGQSFSLTQRFSGASDNSSVSTVEVTVFDGEASDTGTSSAIGSNCSGVTATFVQAERVVLLTSTNRKRRGRTGRE